MSIKAVSIIREPDDRLAKVRISLGSAALGRNDVGIYLVFRGDPAEVLELLEATAEIARRELPAGHYEDKRGRPQG